MKRLAGLSLRSDEDAVRARRTAKEVAQSLGFDLHDQTRIATAVSEIARNVYMYAGQGEAEYFLEEGHAPSLVVRLMDRGPGIADLPAVLGGEYQSRSGLGLGISGARKLMDDFSIETAPGAGTRVTLKKRLPMGVPRPSAALLERISAHPQMGGGSLIEELQSQNQELLRALQELRDRQDELSHLNREMEDTNRGVLALYAELEEKADHLRRADDLKSRFLSNMSHEFRTPVNSIMALARMLLKRTDGELTPEQERQVSLIRKAAESLFELVSDLLDLAKVQSGIVVVRPGELEIAHLFGTLRGMLRPLLGPETVTLSFDDTSSLPPMYSDEAKIGQVLRNLVSNALKFTMHGTVNVSARLSGDGESILFAVQDTGVGIAPEDQERIFHEFAQVESPVQRRVKGTGLGLPLSRRLAELLGGQLWVESRLGAGSTFYASIPLVYQPQVSSAEIDWRADPRRRGVVTLQSRQRDWPCVQELLKESPYQAFPALSARQVRAFTERLQVEALVLYLGADAAAGWGMMEETRAACGELPLVVVGEHEAERATAQEQGAAAFLVKPNRKQLLAGLAAAIGSQRRKTVLIVDDDEVSRYVIRQYLAGDRWSLLEASEPEDGLRKAREELPEVILLDLVMPGMSGHEYLAKLDEVPATRGIPVVLVTSKVLTIEERERLEQRCRVVLSKDTLGPGVLKRAVEEAVTSVASSGQWRLARTAFPIEG